MERPLPPFLSIVVFLRVLFYLQLYSYFSLMIFSTALLTLFTVILMTQLYFLLLISNLLPLLLLIFNFDSILANLDWISWWGHSNLVKFKSLKTQLLHISLSKTPPNFPILFDGSPVSPVNNINILGLNINNKLSWKPHITMVAKAASKKLGILFRLREFFSSEQLLQIYKGLIRPCMEYCSHIWGGSGSSSLLDRVESKAKRLINCPLLSNSLDLLPLFHRYYTR